MGAVGVAGFIALGAILGGLGAWLRLRHVIRTLESNLRHMDTAKRTLESRYTHISAENRRLKQQIPLKYV